MSTADWNKLNDVYFRKKIVYEMVWSEKIDLSKYMVAGAPFGGALALFPDPNSKFLRVHSTSQAEMSILYVFSSSGLPLASIPWTDPIVKMKWTTSERLVCVCLSGVVKIVNVNGDILNQFSLGTSFASERVADCFIWSSGLVARSAGSNKIVAVANLDQPRIKLLPSIESDKPSRCMSAIERSVDPSRAVSSIEIMVCTGEGNLLVLQDSVWEELQLNIGGCDNVVVSVDQSLIAFFNDEGKLFIVSALTKKILSERSTKSKVPPLGMEWCGNDAILLFWPQILLLIGPDGDFVKFSYDDPMVHLVPECDGVRIVSTDLCEFIHKVPSSLKDIFEIGSVSPSAMLYDATEAFENQSAKADEIIRSIQDPQSLQLAIKNCIEAAGIETDTKVQCRLLKAASYGKLFLTDFDPKVFVDSCRIIRVLNSIRYYKIGIPMTFEQFKKCGPESLVQRLTTRYNHLLALKICEYLKVDPNRVLTKWACDKMELSSDAVSDEFLGEAILSKLTKFSGISYAEIANAAFRRGRQSLASMLLDREPKSKDQVPLLISMKLDVEALSKAISSIDTDLIYLVLLGVMMKDEKELFHMIVDKPIAKNLLISYSKLQNPEMLKRLYFYMQQPEEVATLAIREAFLAADYYDRVQHLELSKELFLKVKDSSSAVKMIEEQIALLDIERRLDVKSERALDEKDRNTSFLNLSVNELIIELISQDRMKEVIAVQKQFKVPVKRFMYIQVNAFSKQRRWGEMARLIQGRRAPPIGFQPFIEACVAQNNVQEASRYIKMLQEPGEQMEWFCNIGLWEEAVIVAAIDKNISALHTIGERCNDPRIKSLVALRLEELENP